LIDGNPDLALPLVDGMPQIRAQVVYAARQEMARTLEDVLARRIGLQFYGWQQAKAAAGPAAKLLGAELGWSEAEIDQAAATYSQKL
jgi:glycerol-3-phosphate dehydrogenase